MSNKGLLALILVLLFGIFTMMLIQADQEVTAETPKQLNQVSKIKNNTKINSDT